MAQLVFAEFGRRAGAAFLPGGLGLPGFSLSGAALGQAFGAVAGRAVDTSLFGPIGETGRIDGLTVMESREGAGMPRVYGRYRIGGQVIWSTHLKERSRDRQLGGKGGPSVTDYSYTISFAVALCEGEVTGVDRIWANGEGLSLADLTWRFYPGNETQLPDPLIEASETDAPAYRGTAYIVFEDFPLDDYGARLPQLSFEVVRPVRSDAPTLRDVVTGVNLIPASGEWVYSPDLIRRIEYPGWEETLNRHAASGEVDVRQSLDQLQNELPNVTSVSVTLGWFGTDLRCGACEVRPGVETRDQITLPRDWQVAGLDRANAYLISRDTDDRPVYGGTPEDASVLGLFDELAARGMSITVSPFLLMDIPSGNGLADPYGSSEQAAFPWRGRITAMQDKSLQTRSDVDQFFGTTKASDFSIALGTVVYTGPEEWSYRRFVLHLAALSALSGQVDRFLLGSELRGLTRLRDETGAYPAVEQLIDLAGEVRSLLGQGVEISYAADWTEYGAYHPSDGSGDVLFPLDGLWSSSDIDFVGIDWYPPVSDWRDGEHLDGAIYADIKDPAYLAANIEGGEGYDWFYANETDQTAQIRTPIDDSAHAEDWVFRVKDIRNWWLSHHYERPLGIRSLMATPWLPQSKPIRLIEIGCGAVDKGTNAPNVFLDPKSAESGLPFASTGQRDDAVQAAALLALYDYWSVDGGRNPQSNVYAGPMIPGDGLSVWCWDARPYPAFPSLNQIWSDGENWQTGHWLNGRVTQSDLEGIVRELATEAEITLGDLQLRGHLPGYASTGIVSARNCLDPLVNLFAVSCKQSEEGLCFFNLPDGAITSIAIEDLARDRMTPRGHIYSRSTTEHAPKRLQLTFADLDHEFQPASVQHGEWGDGDQDRHIQVSAALDAGSAEDLASVLYERLNAAPLTETAYVSPVLTSIAVGDLVQFDETEGPRQVTSLMRHGVFQLGLSNPLSGYYGHQAVPDSGDAPVHSPRPDLVVLDLPSLPGYEDDIRPLIGAFSKPWPGQISVEAGRSETSSSVRTVLTQPSQIGRLKDSLTSGVSDRFRPGQTLDFILPDGNLSSRSCGDVLNGANLIAIETAEGWMLAGFEKVEQIASDEWRIGGLITGLFGTDDLAALGADVGARVVVLDETLQRAEFSADDLGDDLMWQVSGPGTLADPSTTTQLLFGKALRPFRPGHLKGTRQSNGNVNLSWTRRTRHSSDSWEGESVPLLEESELYRIDVFLNGERLRSMDVSTTEWVYTYSEQQDDGVVGEEPVVSISQVSAHYGPGAKTSLSLSG